jgi:hypothetical protein
MSAALSHPRSAGVWQSEGSHQRASKPASRSPAIRELPLYIRPVAGEALLSWLLRLATRLNVSTHVLARQVFAIDDRAGHSHWWCRPNPWALQRISNKTGVSIERLRAMTLTQWMPAYREDEDNERFGARHYALTAPERRARRLSVCAQCLEEDRTPHLRVWWMIGWVAVCPRHGTVLVSRCNWCHGKVRVGRLSGVISFAPRDCISCGKDLQDGVCWLADPAVTRLQTALLRGKRDGVTDLEGIGRLSWPETLALVDLMIGAFWTDTSVDEQAQIRAQHEDSDLAPSLVDRFYDTRYGSLLFLTWLLYGWPCSAGARVAIKLLARGLREQPNRSFRYLGINWACPDKPGRLAIAPEIRGRLRVLLQASEAVVGTVAATEPRRW